MWLSKPIPTEDRTTASFRYYQHSCRIANQGGHRNPDKVRELYRHSKHSWPVYEGIWCVYMDGSLELKTSSLAEAQDKFDQLKAKCLYLRQEEIAMSGDDLSFRP